MSENKCIVIPQERVETKIINLRKVKVILDKDIAQLYDVKPIALRQQVKRNIDRFPDDFMFQLSKEEVNILVSQNVIADIRSLGGHLPYAFTEQGIAMLSSVLNSKRAIKVNIQIMRTFLRLRQMAMSYQELRMKIEKLEKRYNNQFKLVFEAMKKLLDPPQKKKAPIGFGKN